MRNGKKNEKKEKRKRGEEGKDGESFSKGSRGRIDAPECNNRAMNRTSEQCHGRQTVSYVIDVWSGLHR